MAQRRRPTRRRFAGGRASAIGLGLLLLAGSARAQELIQFDLEDRGPGLALIGPGVVITGSDALTSDSTGLGVVGGSPLLSNDPDSTVDDGEFIWIVFTSPHGALDVSLWYSGRFNQGAMLLDAYGPGGEVLLSALPVQAATGGTHVSTLAGGLPVGAFRLETLPDQGVDPSRLDFLPAPEPGASGALAALTTLAVRALRARRTARS